MGATLAASRCFESCRFGRPPPEPEAFYPEGEVPEIAKPTAPPSATTAETEPTAEPTTLYRPTGVTTPRRAEARVSKESVESAVRSETAPSESPPSTKRETGRSPPSAYAASAKLLELPPVSHEAWELITQAIEENAVGAYLVYNPANNGCWQCVWSRKLIPDAWAYTRPATPSEIPGYKFGGRRESLAVGIHSSNELLCLGWVEFLKLARRHHGSFVLLPAITKPENRELLPPFVIALHDVTSQLVHHVKPGDPPIANLHEYDAVAVVAGQRGPAAIAEMIGPKVTPAMLATTATRYGQGLVFLEGL